MARTSMSVAPLSWPLQRLLRLIHSLGVDLVVLRVRANELDVGPLRAVGECDDQAVVVPLDVEHHAVASDYAGIPELGLHVSRACPLSKPCNFVPRFKGSLRIPILWLAVEVDKRGMRADVHKRMIVTNWDQDNQARQAACACRYLPSAKQDRLPHPRNAPRPMLGFERVGERLQAAVQVAMHQEHLLGLPAGGQP